MTRGVTFLRMYPSDWRSGCLGLTLEQEGLYIRMCMFMAEVGRRVPMDDSQAAKMLGTNINQYRKVLGDLLRLGKIRRHDDGYGNDRAEHEISAAKGASDRSSTQGKNGSDREADQDENGPTPTATPQVTRGVTGGVTPPVQAENHQQNQSQSIEPVANSRKDTPLPPKRGGDPVELYEALAAQKQSRQRGQRLSSDWQLPDDWRQWARTNCFAENAEITRQAEVFRDYWIAKPGAQAAKLDWEATWRNWCRKAFSPAGRHQGIARPAATGSFTPKRQTFVDYDEENRRVAEMARKLVDQAVAGVTP